MFISLATRHGEIKYPVIPRGMLRATQRSNDRNQKIITQKHTRTPHQTRLPALRASSHPPDDPRDVPFDLESSPEIEIDVEIDAE